MSEFYNLPVGKRTRHQRLLYAQGLNGIDESRSCGSSKNQDKKRNRETNEITKKGSNGAGRSTKRKLDEAIKDEKSPSYESDSEEEESDEKGVDGTKSRTCGSSSGYGQDDIEVIDVDDYWINRNGSEGSSSSTKRELHEAKPVEKSLVDESEEEQSNENGSGVRFTSIDREESSVDVSTEHGSNGEEATDTAAVAKNKKKECYGSAIPFKSGTDTYFHYSSDGSNSDDMVVSDDEEEGFDNSESDSDGSGWFNYFPPKKIPNHPSANQQSPTSTKKEFVSGSVEKKVAEQDTESDDSDHLLTKKVPKVRDEKEQVRGPCMTKKGKRKEYGCSIDAILDSIIIGQEHDVQEKEGDNSIPLKFRFDESDDESANQITDESDVEALFQQMNFELQSEEIGSYGNPKVGNQDKDGYEDHEKEATHINCDRGNHGDIYFEEETGLRCRSCGAVILESKYVVPKLANYAPGRPRRSYHSNEQQFFTSETPYFQDLDGSPFEICMQTKGTVWELIPVHIRGQLLRHQQEGLKFLWENLAGTIELQGLQNLGPRGNGSGGGCIISHSPGTGKTLLTIVFMETFLKKFPGCCPVIVAPASILLTWEAEFKKWKVGIKFINLNNESLPERNIGCFKNNKDWIRAINILSWSKGESVLGLSYNLFEQIAGSSNTKNAKLAKMGNRLLDLPGLVVLDEGHTPRNERSNIWNILLKLKTKNRVVLSGTPFQNNFRELFNTFQLVRPKIATKIANEKVFAGMIQGRNSNKSTSMSTSEAIEKLRVIIAPFVNYYEGLESKLPGLFKRIILLNPPPLQKGLIEKCRNVSTTTFEYEHKVALVSVHPSLILHCCLSEKEVKSTERKILENVRLHADEGAKTRIVMELIRLSLSLGEKVLIFSQYIQPLELLKEQITLVFGWEFGREFLLIKGRINQKLRQTIISDFNNPDSESKVLLASTKCCSEGIHLIGASRVVLLDVVWNPSVETQAISRAHRLGQKKVVYTYHLMAAGTTEEDKYDRQVEKGRLAEMVFSSSAGEDPKMVNRDVSELNDKILQKMVDHPKLKGIFKKIRYVENKTRI